MKLSGRQIFQAFVTGFICPFSIVWHLICLCNPFWFRESWLNFYYRSDFSYFNPFR